MKVAKAIPNIIRIAFTIFKVSGLHSLQWPSWHTSIPAINEDQCPATL